MKRVVIISGGTMNYIAVHQALCAPAYGGTGRALQAMCQDRWNPWERGDRVQVGGSMFEQLRKYTADVDLIETKMAGGDVIETNADVEKLVDELVDDLNVKVIFMPVALCDFEPDHYSVYGPYCGEPEPSFTVGRGAKRLSSKYRVDLHMKPAAKIIQKIRSKRKDIFLVGFKTTDGVSEQEQYLAGLNLLKASSCNLVLANDVRTRVNMIITPEEAKYHVTTNRGEALRNLVDMTYWRSHLTFTRSTVVAGEPVPWESELVPAALRKVVDHCISAGAYKPFRGATVGHFACKLPSKFVCSLCGEDRDGLCLCRGGVEVERGVFLTSRRKTNFNDLPKLGLVRIETDGPDTVLAYGSKPSVGGQSQRIIFAEHPEYDCIVHFHCPLRDVCRECGLGRDAWCHSPGAAAHEWHAYHKAPAHEIKIGPVEIPTVSQREYECGSHQCGQNTSRGLRRFGNLACVFLDQHGPNIVFHHSIDPQEVINFIEANFDLTQKTGGPV